MAWLSVFQVYITIQLTEYCLVTHLVYHEQVLPVFISELLGGEISPPKFSDSPPKMLRHVVNYTVNTNISLSKFACSLPILVA